MRTSRVSQETSRFFSGTSEPTITPRRSTRSTRSNLDRFACDTPSTPKDDTSEVTYGSDIEDAIKSTSPSPPPHGATRQATRKRKRTTTVTAPGRAPRTIKTEVKAETTTAAAAAAPAPRRVRKPARKTTDPLTGTTTVSPPADWEEVYAVAKQMRLTGAAANAAVDTMGCERLAGPGASARDRRFHTLVALMLSSQTKDTVNAEAMRRLQAEMPACAPGAPAGLNLENMLAVDPVVLNEMIGKVGFHNNKTK